MNPKNTVKKDMVELIQFAKVVNGVTIIPVEMTYNETECHIFFNIVNKKNKERTIERYGKHNNFVFETSIYNIPLTVNLLTNVIKEKRDFKDYDF